MKSTFALFVLAALTPCLVTIERLAAAAPEAAGDACCEKSCCAEKTGAGDQACCDQASDCKQSTAGSPCSQGDATSTAASTSSECSECELKTAAGPDGVGLKLFWTLPLSAPKGATLSATELTKPCTSSPCASSACANSPVASASGSSKEETGNGFCLPSQLRYAAIPAAVPSPFAKGGEYLSAPVLATQAYAATLPLQAPPAPVTQASVSVVAPQPVACTKCTATTAACEKTAEATQVLFSIEVFVDESGSLNEFESLQRDMSFMTADSEVVLATLRILEKQKLVRSLWSPKMVTVAGRPAIFKVGTELATTDGASPTFEGFSTEVHARELGGGLAIEFKFCDTTGRQCYEVATSLLLAHGETVVMKACHPDKQRTGNAESSDHEHPVYVVLTPQVVR